MSPSAIVAPVVILAALALGGRPVYSVGEHAEVPITAINAETKRFTVKLPKGGGSQALSVGPKTWFIKDDEEATFASLRVGQLVRVHFIPRGAQAVAVEILTPRTKDNPKP